MNPKSLLRKSLRNILNEVDPLELSAASSAICQHFCAKTQLSSPTPIIATYAAHGPEVDLQSLHHLIPNAQFVYPRCHPNGILSFHHTPNHTELTPGTLGILEPNPNQHQRVEIGDIDFFLCPGLAFGKDATRLGHGGGYYDRALAKRSSSAITIGIGLEIQIFDTVPHDHHDIHLDHILTENGYV